MHPSRSRTVTRRKLPALCGMSGSIELNSPIIALAVEHARDSLSPPGIVVGVVAKVELDAALVGIDPDRDA